MTTLNGERLHRESFVLDLHAHGRGFVPQPFRTVWRGVTAGAPAEVGFDALRKGGVDAVVAKAVGDPVVTRCYLGRSPWDAVEAQLARIERQTAEAGAVVVDSVDGSGAGPGGDVPPCCSVSRAPTPSVRTSTASMPGTSVVFA